MNKGLGKFFTKKILKLITLLVALCIITFALMELSPIDPVTAYVGASTKVSAEQRALIAEHWGLNQPALVRFWSWFKSIIIGDWGTSMIYRRPVLEVIGQKFLSSIWLMGISWILSGVIGFVLGIISGVKEGKLKNNTWLLLYTNVNTYILAWNIIYNGIFSITWMVPCCA